MKKISFWAMTVAVAGLCLMGCKSKGDNNTAEGNAEGTSAEQVGGEASANGDGVSAELEDLYTICPFCLQVDGKVDAEGNPVTEDRTWVCGSSVGTSTIADWVIFTQDPRFAFNKDGWHFVGKDIVNAAETYKINDEDAYMSLSSYCTIRTEKYTRPDKVELHEHNTYCHLYTTDDAEMEAPLLKTQGNRHDYKGEDAAYIQTDELTDRVITSFYLQEYVTVSLPAELADQDVTLAVVRYQPVYEGVTYDADKLAEALWTGKPEVSEETGYATADFYISQDEPVGCYDLLLIQGQKVQHRLTMMMTQEPAEK